MRLRFRQPEPEFALIHKETGEKVVIKANADWSGYHRRPKELSNWTSDRGVWTVTETKTPAGFKPIDPFEVTISGQGQVFSFIAEDKEIKAALQVVKVDEVYRTDHQGFRGNL